MMRLSRTSGVRPIESELSSYQRGIGAPIWRERSDRESSEFSAIKKASGRARDTRASGYPVSYEISQHSTTDEPSDKWPCTQGPSPFQRVAIAMDIGNGQTIALRFSTPP